MNAGEAGAGPGVCGAAPNLPKPLSPQQASVPFVRTPQEVTPPALTAVKLPAGGEACPKALSPQQASVPSVLIPQAVGGPAAVSGGERAGGGLVCPRVVVAPAGQRPGPCWRPQPWQCCRPDGGDGREPPAGARPDRRCCRPSRPPSRFPRIPQLWKLPVVAAVKVPVGGEARAGASVVAPAGERPVGPEAAAVDAAGADGGEAAGGGHGLAGQVAAPTGERPAGPEAAAVRAAGAGGGEGAGGGASARPKALSPQQATRPVAAHAAGVRARGR